MTWIVLSQVEKSLTGTPHPKCWPLISFLKISLKNSPKGRSPKESLLDITISLKQNWRYLYLQLCFEEIVMSRCLSSCSRCLKWRTNTTTLMCCSYFLQSYTLKGKCGMSKGPKTFFLYHLVKFDIYI